jgi:hypothetical protein
MVTAGHDWMRKSKKRSLAGKLETARKSWAVLGSLASKLAAG